ALAAMALGELSKTLAAPLVWLAEASTYLLVHGVDPFTRAGVASLRLPAYTGAASTVYALHYAPLLLLAHALLRWRPLADTPHADDTAAEEFEPESRGVGEAAVSEYRWWRGLSHIDYVLATHADADHIDGLNDILKNFGARAAVVGHAPLDDEEYTRFSQTA